MLRGGFTKFRPVEEDDLKVFQEATEGLTGVDYEPLIVATQVVTGTNYEFICNAEAVVLTPRPYLAEISIFQPLPSEKETKPVITSIHAID